MSSEIDGRIFLTHDFEVICDETNNSQDDIKNNHLIIDIIFTPKKII